MRRQCPHRDSAGIRCCRYFGHPGVHICHTSQDHGKHETHIDGHGVYGGFYRRQQREDAKAKRRAGILARLRSLTQSK